MSKIERAVAAKMHNRAEFGLNKYGVTMERTDLSRLDWLIHAQEEAMDLAVYLEKLIRDEIEISQDLKVGDVVVVANDFGCVKRGDMGVVSKIHVDSDGEHKVLYQVRCPRIEFFMDRSNLKYAEAKF